MQEVIFVGLPGPTHNYGGLSKDNVASSSNEGSASNPREAALQALDLVEKLAELGLTVGVLPPQLRPHMPLLRTEFSGSDEEVIAQAAKNNPTLLEKASSSSAMWVANAATIAPPVDAKDNKLHLTTANLQTNLHRRIEAEDTHRILSAIFANVPGSLVHAPLAEDLRDEGAANHTRLAPSHEESGLHVFVYGTDGSAGDPPTARQTLAASKAIQKQHNIPDNQAVFIKQHPDMIKAGVFHNDVIAVGNESVLLVHEQAYANGRADIAQIEKAYSNLFDGELPDTLIVSASELSVEEAVRTYFFNSQIITLPDFTMAIIAPMEVKELYGGKAAKIFDRFVEDDFNPIDAVHYVDLRQSMRNGGGPACLRLRVPMEDRQVQALKNQTSVLANPARLVALRQAIAAHYPEHLMGQDLADPVLLARSRQALAALAQVLHLPLLPA